MSTGACLPKTGRGRDCVWGLMMLNFQPFLAMFAGQQAKPAALGQHFTQTAQMVISNLEAFYSVFSCGHHVWQEDHPQTSTQCAPGRLGSHPDTTCSRLGYQTGRSQPVTLSKRYMAVAMAGC